VVAERQRFPHIGEVDAPAGAEDWRDLYSYYLLPDEETRPHEEQLFWLQERVHHAHPYYPFDTIAFEAWGLACSQYTTRVFPVPPVMGLDQRIVNGYLYFATVPVTDPAEIERRAEHFMQRAGYYFENWDDLFEKWKVKAEANIHEMEAIEFKSLPHLEPIEMVHEGRGRSTGYDVLVNYNALIDRFLLMQQYHFEMLNIGYGAYITFFEFCKEVFPDISDQEVARMVSGLEFINLRPDEELKNLARSAVELEITDALLAAGAADDILASLDQSEGGKEWLRRLEAVKYPWFNFSPEYGYYHDQRAWVDDMSVPVRGIQDHIRRLQRGEVLDRPTERLQRESEELAEQYRSFLDDDEVRGQFEQLLGLSRTVFPYIEDHNFYVEHWSHTVFWNKVRDLGTLFVEQGVLLDQEDVFYLTRHEVSQVLFDTVQAWGVGTAARGIQRNRAKVEKRRKILAILREWQSPPALGQPPEVVNDPLLLMNYGITAERVQEWLVGVDEDVETLNGVAAAPGTVEGLVRVIRTEKDLDTVLENEILVCPTTAPSWASVFSRISAVVADAGGMMSHAAIVCREYDVPAVVGVGHATAILKTGQRVRVDGRRGQVTILERVSGNGAVAAEESQPAELRG
jgi:pyruvate,water dikinase